MGGNAAVEQMTETVPCADCGHPSTQFELSECKTCGDKLCWRCDARCRCMVVEDAMLTPTTGEIGDEALNGLRVKLADITTPREGVRSFGFGKALTLPRETFKR